MTYEEWVITIDKLKNRSINHELLEKLKSDPSNVQAKILPQIIEMLDVRFELSVKNMIDNLETMFEDENMLDLFMVKFKKEIIFLNDLCHLEIIPPDIKRKYMIKIKDETDKVYDIIERESLELDYTGYLKQIIKHNRIKWSD